jgi:uncharacterized RDD family membrane protein YckC
MPRTLGPPAPQQAGRALSRVLRVDLAIGLGFLWIAFDDRKQGWHDKIAGTVVIRKPR